MSLSKTITAENSWLTFLVLGRGSNGATDGPGKFDLSISDVSDSTVSLERSWDDGVTFKTIEEYTEDVEKVVEIVTSRYYRVGIETGDYGTESSVTVRVAR